MAQIQNELENNFSLSKPKCIEYKRNLNQLMIQRSKLSSQMQHM